MKMLRLVAAALLTATAVTASDANVFVNGKGVYDSYQQAWRMLGFFVDCAGQDEDDHHDRKLQGGEQEGCQRYLLWAAVSQQCRRQRSFVDPFAHYDRSMSTSTTKEVDWASTACGILPSTRTQITLAK